MSYLRPPRPDPVIVAMAAELRDTGRLEIDTPDGPADAATVAATCRLIADVIGGPVRAEQVAGGLVVVRDRGDA